MCKFQICTCADDKFKYEQGLPRTYFQICTFEICTSEIVKHYYFCKNLLKNGAIQV